MSNYAKSIEPIVQQVYESIMIQYFVEFCFRIAYIYASLELNYINYTKTYLVSAYRTAVTLPSSKYKLHTEAQI